MFKVIALPLALAATAVLPTAALAKADAPLHFADRLNDKALQTQVASMAALFSTMMLDLKIAPFANAMGEIGGKMGGEAMPKMAPNTRMRDMIGPDAKDMPQTLAREVPRMMGMMATMGSAMEAMMPQLQDMARKMGQQMERGRPNS